MRAATKAAAAPARGERSAVALATASELDRLSLVVFGDRPGPAGHVAVAGSAAEVVLLREVSERAERHAQKARGVGLDAARAPHRLAHEAHALLLQVLLEVHPALERDGRFRRVTALRAADVEGQALHPDLLAHLERDGPLDDV